MGNTPFPVPDLVKCSSINCPSLWYEDSQNEQNLLLRRLVVALVVVDVVACMQGYLE